MVFLDHVQNLHIHAEKTHKDSGAHYMNMLILYMVQKTHTGPYYRVQALFMYGVLVEISGCHLVKLFAVSPCGRRWQQFAGVSPPVKDQRPSPRARGPATAP